MNGQHLQQQQPLLFSASPPAPRREVGCLGKKMICAVMMLLEVYPGVWAWWHRVAANLLKSLPLR